jgi:Mrp family chromosome partitioning ATPase/capsular polysaccharide biosynthesis protein
MSAHTDYGERGHGLARFVGTVRERWWLIFATVVVLGGAAFAVSTFLLEPRYSATAQVTYSQRDADAVSKALTDAGTAGLPKTLSSDALILRTSAFTERVSKAMGGSLSPDLLRSSLGVSTVPGVEVIDIKATASQADLAANVANACAEEFVKTRQEELRGLLQSALEFVQGRIASLAPAEQSSGISSALEQQKYALSSLLSSTLADYKMLEKASIPASPYFPRPYFNLVLGLAAGFVLGLVLAILRGSLDRRIKELALLERVMDLPVLGAMPAAPGKQSGKRNGVGYRKGNEPLLEATRMLRSNLKVLGFGDTKRSILITSTAPDEGKSVLAINLTLSMALAGDRVILVDADLRNPSIDRYLDIPNTKGLGDALADGSVGWSETIKAVDLAPFVDPRLMSSRNAAEDESGVSKFLCLTSGTLPTNPTELLESPAMASLLAELQGYSDYVIVDGPPMLATSDSLILAQSLDAVILASTLGRETAAQARQVRQLLARADIQALGLVVCGTRSRDREGYPITHR